MKFDKNIFSLSPDQWLKVGVKTNKFGKAEEEILYIFWLSKYLFNKEPLTTDDIVAAYYNIYTEGKNKPIKNKKNIVMRLFLLKKKGIIETVNRGKYKIHKPTTSEQEPPYLQYLEKCIQWENEYKKSNNS